MLATSTTRMPGWGLGTLGLAFLGAAVLAGPTVANPPPEKAEPKVKRKVPRRPGSQVTPTRGKSSPRAAQRSAFEMDPAAKWACDKTSVTLEPTWRGAKNLTFNFDIRNEGTADLKIKARGG